MKKLMFVLLVSVTASILFMGCATTSNKNTDKPVDINHPGWSLGPLANP